MGNLPLAPLDLFGAGIVSWIDNWISFNWLVAILSGLACFVMVYILGLVLGWGWRTIVAFGAIALALNAVTPLVNNRPPWLSTLVVVIANLVCGIAVAVRLRRFLIKEKELNKRFLDQN